MVYLQFHARRLINFDYRPEDYFNGGKPSSINIQLLSDRFFTNRGLNFIKLFRIDYKSMRSS